MRRFFDNCDYLSIAIFLKPEYINRINAILKHPRTKGGIKTKAQPHITILYAPLSSGVSLAEAIAKVKEIKHINWPKKLTFIDSYVSSFNTLNLVVSAEVGLHCLHQKVVSHLQDLIHIEYLNLFDSQTTDIEYHPYIHTKNIGVNYKSHVTLGVVDNENKENSVIQRLNKSCLFNFTCKEVVFSDAKPDTMNIIDRITFT